jgi:prepilin signal peptidase PulO-like enzyme (type II secretory pathway)
VEHDAKPNRLTVIRLASAAAGTAMSSVFFAPLPALLHGLLLPVALTIAFSDFRRYRIDRLALGLALGLGFCFVAARSADAGLTGHAVLVALLQAGGRGGVIFAFFWVVNLAYGAWRWRTGIASGDLVLFAVAGVWLPLDAYPVFVLVASLGALTATILRNKRRGKKLLARTYVPFGGFLAVSLWLTVISTGFS